MPDDDASALARLRRAVEAGDPPPGHLRAAALAAYTDHPSTTEVAELVADSALAEPQGLRAEPSPSPVRILEFRRGEFAVRIETELDGGVLHLQVHTTPADVHTLRVRRPDGIRTVRPAPEGPTLLQAPPGPLSVLCLRRGGRAVATSWTLL